MVQAIEIHTLLVNGEEKIFAMIHQSQGFKLHKYDSKTNSWQPLALNPLWKDASGSDRPSYTLPKYYETFRTAVIIVNGQQKLLAMIRYKNGLELHQYDPLNNAWIQLSNGPSWADSTGYACVECYKTIRTEVITTNNKQKLLAMILCSAGLELHQYDPDNNLWSRLAMGPAWSHSSGYFFPKYYETIRTAVITVNEQQKLLAMIRYRDGIELHQYDPLNNSWIQLSNGPSWADSTGYACEPCYKTVRTEVIIRNSKQKLLAMILCSAGLELHQYDPENNLWSRLAMGPAWSYSKGYFPSKYYETIRSVVTTVNGQQKLLVMIRYKNGLELHQYDPDINVWKPLPLLTRLGNMPDNGYLNCFESKTWKNLSFSPPLLGHVGGIDNPEYYKTIRVVTIQCKDSPQLIFSMRDHDGFKIWRYNVDLSIATNQLIAHKSIICEMPISKIEQLMYQVIEKIRYTLEQTPILHPTGYAKYPASGFRIENIYYIKRDENVRNYKEKKLKFKTEGTEPNTTWLFHASQTQESTESIVKSNLSPAYLGTNTGNAGFIGQGVYFSPLAYFSIYVSSVRTKPHYTFFACKVLQGKQKKVDYLSSDQWAKGVPVDSNYNSHISVDNSEVVVPDAKQILPVFLVQFSMFKLEDKGLLTWKAADGSEKSRRNLYADGQEMSRFT